MPLREGIGEILGKKVGRGTCKCWGTVVVPGNQHSSVAESIANAHPVGQTELPAPGRSSPSGCCTCGASCTSNAKS